MPKFWVHEIVVYEVNAVDEADAVQFIIDTANRDQYVIEVTDRYAVEVK